MNTYRTYNIYNTHITHISGMNLMLQGYHQRYPTMLSTRSRSHHAVCGLLRLVTALNHLAVSGLLSRQAISGEMMSKMNVGTSVQ